VSKPLGITQSAPGSYNAQAADNSTAIVNVYGQPVQAAKVSREEIAAAQARLAQLPLDGVAPIATLPEASRMPHAHNPNFVGRDDDLKRFAQFLKAGATAVATGLGGIGKTQIAVEFVLRYGTYFPGGVFWLSFASAEGVPAEIAQCGQRMNLRLDYSGLRLEDQVQIVRAAWESELPRLLIFDNCEDEALLRAFRPVTGGSRVLVTSRREQWDASLNVQAVPVGMLSVTDSAALLRKLNPQLPATSDAVLRQIGEELGGLPLALHLAGSYLCTYQRVRTPEAVLAELRTADAVAQKVLSGEFGAEPLVLPTQHDRNVYRTFQLSFGKLDESQAMDALALRLLACAACLAPGEPIPYTLLVMMVLAQDASVDERERVEDALARLTGLGLLETASEQPPTFRLHRLLQRFVQKAREPTMAGARERVEQVVLAEAERMNAAGLVKPLTTLQPQLPFVTDAAVGLRKAALSTVLGHHLKRLGDYLRAKEYYDRALTIRQAERGEAHSDTVASMNDMGFVLKDLGQHAEAQHYFERALKINEAVHGEQSPEMATSLNNLGLICKDLGQHAEAQHYFERALRINEAVHGERHPDTVASLNNLGFVLKDLGWYAVASGAAKDLGQHAEAQHYFERALRINEAMLGQRHSDTVASLNNLGFVLMDQWLLGDWRDHADQSLSLRAEAQHYFERALKINEYIHGEQSLETAASLNNLGELFTRRGGDARVAQRYFERALAIRKQVLGERHPEIAESLNNVGRMLLLQQDYKDARPCFEQALAIREQVLGKNHLDTLSSARILSNLGWAIYQSEVTSPPIDQVMHYLEQALHTLERTLGPKHEETQAARQVLQSVQARMD
jgi:tetratricopeptide (TPR) repeat protein